MKPGQQLHIFDFIKGSLRSDIKDSVVMPFASKFYYFDPGIVTKWMVPKFKML
jgi:hypothetical protein